MASDTVVSAPPKKGKSGGWIGGCCGCLVLVALVGAVGLAKVFHAGALKAAETILADEVGQGEWKVDFPGSAPFKWLTGGASDLHVKGANIQTKGDGYKIDQFALDVTNLAFDLKASKVKSCNAADFSLTLGEEAVSKLITSESVGKNGISAASAGLADGKLTINFTVDAGGKSLECAVETTPKVTPPATIALVVGDVTVESEDLPDAVKEKVAAAMKQGLQQAFKEDLSKSGKIKTLKEVKVGDKTLTISGGLDPAALSPAGDAGAAKGAKEEPKDK